jgi:hypothetical protein
MDYGKLLLQSTIEKDAVMDNLFIPMTGNGSTFFQDK